MNELRLIVRLWLQPEADAGEYEQFERDALQVLQQHGGQIERAFRLATPSNSESSNPDEPFEVHLVSFPDEAAFDAYRADAQTLALTARRERLIARTEIWRGTEVNYGI